MSTEMRFYKLQQCQDEGPPWVRVEDFSKVKILRPVVLVNGAFDILHSGHMKVIFAARRRGPTLIAAVDGDERVRMSKGLGRPIQTWIERATTLGYMPLDYIVEIGSESEMDKLMKVLQPEIRVQGGDYQGQKSRYPSVKKYFVMNCGMRTSKIVERILQGERNGGI
jgi:cytidyltransferase-like protein